MTNEIEWKMYYTLISFVLWQKNVQSTNLTIKLFAKAAVLFRDFNECLKSRVDKDIEPMFWDFPSLKIENFNI